MEFQRKRPLKMPRPTRTTNIPSAAILSQRAEAELVFLTLTWVNSRYFPPFLGILATLQSSDQQRREVLCGFSRARIELHGQDGRHDAAEYSFGRALKAATTPREEALHWRAWERLRWTRRICPSALDFYQRALSLLEQIDGEAKTVTRWRQTHRIYQASSPRRRCGDALLSREPSPYPKAMGLSIETIRHLHWTGVDFLHGD